MKQIRQDNRNLCADLLKIRWTDAAGVRRKDFAALEDISPNGACLQVEQPIALGCVVTIQHPNGKYQGQVKYCKFQITGYFIGIEFDSGFRWSRREYDPAHLLQPRVSAKEKRD